MDALQRDCGLGWGGVGSVWGTLVGGGKLGAKSASQISETVCQCIENRSLLVWVRVSVDVLLLRVVGAFAREICTRVTMRLVLQARAESGCRLLVFVVCCRLEGVSVGRGVSLDAE